VKNRFQSSPFKCNLQRYSVKCLKLTNGEEIVADEVGLYKSS
jgi:hypothetical protein